MTKDLFSVSITGPEGGISTNNEVKEIYLVLTCMVDEKVSVKMASTAFMFFSLSHQQIKMNVAATMQVVPISVSIPEQLIAVLVPQDLPSIPIKRLVIQVNMFFQKTVVFQNRVSDCQCTQNTNLKGCKLVNESHRWTVIA